MKSLNLQVTTFCEFSVINFYFDLLTLLNHFNGGIRTNIHKATHPLGSVGS